MSRCDTGRVLDDDLDSMSRDDLVAEVRKLRAGIRVHRDSSSHNLCWYHPELWSLVPDESTVTVEVPPWPQFLRGCIAYRRSLDEELPDAPVDVSEYEP